MILCIDANVVIDLARGRSEAIRAIWIAVSLTDQSIVMPSLVLHELETGALLSERPDWQRERLEDPQRALLDL